MSSFPSLIATPSGVSPSLVTAPIYSGESGQCQEYCLNTSTCPILHLPNYIHTVSGVIIILYTQDIYTMSYGGPNIA